MKPFRIALTLSVFLAVLIPVWMVKASPSVAHTYYVSSSSGLDTNPGTQAQPFRTISKINQLQSTLLPGDQVLFKCGDTWRGEFLTLTKSGSSGSPITYSSNPAGCANQPVFSGTQTIGDWSVWNGNIYVANLSTGVNSGKFPYGINQLFRDGTRLALGRWPNINAPDGGYSTVDSQPDSNHLTDAELPSGSWAGAVIHLKVIRWSMVNRSITGVSGKTLQLENGVSCPYTSNCSGWGYFINNSLSALDQDGEWFYDKSAQKIYLYANDSPTSHLVEGSILPSNSSDNLGAINLGPQLGMPVSYLTIDNFSITGWFKHGIVSPTNLSPNENSYITLQNNQILNVDADGINLWTWVYSASDGKDDWRGGNNISILNNLIDGANHFGIHTPSRYTTIQGNTIRNIALISNLNESGMGCGTNGNEGTCTEDGAALRIYRSDQDLSGNNFTIRYNRFEKIGSNGVMIFGHTNTVQNNVFIQNCYSKGDCGAINTFGNGSLSSTPVYDIQILDNIILDTIGNTDGAHPDFRALFGFGIYLDNASKNVTSSGNTIANTTVHGILYQNTTGSITNNKLIDNVSGSMWGDQVCLTGGITSVSSFTGNTLVSRNNHSYDLGLESAGMISSAANNRYDHTLRSDMINLGGTPRTLAQWQSASGKDTSGTVSTTGGNVGQYFLVYNDTQANKTYDPSGWPTCYPNGSAVTAPITLAPYTSQILYHCGPAAHQVMLPVIRR